MSLKWIEERTYTKHWTDCHVPQSRDEYVTLRFEESALIIDGERLRFDSGPVDSSGDAVQFDGSRHVDRLGRVQHDIARRVFQDERLRYDTGRKRVDPRKPPPSDWPRNLRAFTTLFDGRLNLQYLPAERGDYSEGYIFRNQKNLFRTTLRYLPIVMTFRPSWLGISLNRCQLKHGSEKISNQECWILVDNTGLRREFWLDHARDFIVVAYAEECDVLGVRMKSHLNIKYDQDAHGNWIPSTWTTTFIDSQGLVEQYAATTVVEATVNHPIGPKAFEFEFPAAAWVFDEATGQHSIVGPDQIPQPVNRKELERGMTYNDLLERRAKRGIIHSFLDSPARWIGIQYLVISLFFCGLAAWVWMRFARNGRNTTAQETANS